MRVLPIVQVKDIDVEWLRDCIGVVRCALACLPVWCCTRATLSVALLLPCCAARGLSTSPVLHSAVWQWQVVYTIIAACPRVEQVMQEPKLLSGTIRENIALGKRAASFEDITAAAKLANAHDFILQQPQVRTQTAAETCREELVSARRVAAAVVHAGTGEHPVQHLLGATLCAP